MFSEKHHIHSITGEELDRYLNKGWYRMGQTVSTCHFLFFDGDIYPPVWIRLPLKGYQLRKSLRKIKRRVEDRFRVEIKEGIIDPVKEHLFQQYRLRFKGNIAPTLSASLLDNRPNNIFHSLSVEVYDGPQLIAFSIFDIGRTSLASIKGVYHPEYAKFSLGLYTMIREIEYGIGQGFKYYYPGYVVPGYSRFDYKLRIGRVEEVEYFDIKSTGWKKYKYLEIWNLPARVQLSKLSTLGELLAREGIQCLLSYFHFYTPVIFGYHKTRAVKSPLFLSLFSNYFPNHRFFIYYDIWKEAFVFSHSLPKTDLDILANNPKNEKDSFFYYNMAKSPVILQTKNLRELIKQVKQTASHLKSSLG